MDVQPVLKALKRQKLAALLIALQITLVCAIVCNVLFLIVERVARSRIPSGVAETELIRISNVSLAEQEDVIARALDDAAALRSLPGVLSVAATQQVPFGGSSWSLSLNTAREQRDSIAHATTYYDGGGLVTTLGLNLLVGRDFTPEEYINVETADPSVVIVTQALAAKLWPGQSPLGRPLYMGETAVRVVGVVQNLVRPSIQSPQDAFDSLILPLRHAALRSGQFVLRVEPQRREQVLAAAKAEMRKLQANRLILHADTFEEVHENYFRRDRVMAGLLGTVVVVLLIVTSLGIVGLASFWVQQRRRHIGIRRALGATRQRILRYFQIENFLIVTAGVAAGMFLAYGINAWLMAHYELPRLPLIYLPIGAVVMWTLGQLAVLPPALGAARLPPAAAVRDHA